MATNYMLSEFTDLCDEMRMASRLIKKVQRIATGDAAQKNLLGLTESDLILLDQARHIIVSESYALNALRQDLETRSTND